ncbi:Ff.00g132710.m01.CDS01 [Fusarium sp. VM40]|nr:Ff.00g132710.m01.CDS01 [Fusarium sp. VM40]
MTSALWDPEHLLQITHGIRDRCGKVNCFGNAKYNVRCRWDIEEPNRSKIRPLLDQMSQTLPESITTDTLRRLARLCLCSNYHSHQVEIFVSDWQTVINAAVQCNKRMIQAQANEVESQLPVRTVEVVQLEMNLSMLQHEYAELQARLDLISMESNEKIAKVNKEAQDHKVEYAAKELAFREMLSYQQAWKDQAAEESECRRKAEQETAVLQVRLEKLDGQLRDFESVQGDNNKLKGQVALLAEECKESKRVAEDEMKKSKDVEQQRVDERALAQLTAQQYQTQLDQERSDSAVLKGRIGVLESAITELQDGIMSCWSHRFWGWMARAKKGGVSRSRIASQRETATEIALKTYA